MAGNLPPAEWLMEAPSGCLMGAILKYYKRCFSRMLSLQILDIDTLPHISGIYQMQHNGERLLPILVHD